MVKATGLAWAAAAKDPDGAADALLRLFPKTNKGSKELTKRQWVDNAGLLYSKASIWTPDGRPPALLSWGLSISSRPVRLYCEQAAHALPARTGARLGTRQRLSWGPRRPVDLAARRSTYTWNRGLVGRDRLKAQLPTRNQKETWR